MDVYWETSYRVFLVGDGNNYCLSIKDGKVIVDDPNPNDLNQYWIKDYSSKEKDAHGSLAFSLINKGTGQALQHAGGGDDNTQPTKLIQYNPNKTDLSTLFTENQVPGSAHTRIRLQNFINWHLYVLWGSTTKAGSEVRQGDVEKVTGAIWKMEPQRREPAWRLLVKPNNPSEKNASYCLSIRNGKVVVVKVDPNDRNQYWIRDNRFSSNRDTEGYPAFALFNRGTHEALVHQGGGDGVTEQPTKLTKYNMLSDINRQTLFTEGPDVGDGFRVIKLQNYVNWFLFVKWGSAADASEVCQCVKGFEEPAKWKLELAIDVINYSA